MSDTWTFTAADGDLLIHTDVTGRAARTGHRLRIAMRTWQAEATFDGDIPATIDATIEVDSLEVVSGEGGLTPMSGPEKGVARANALKSLNAKKFPEITYRAASIDTTDSGYTISGELTIHGTSRTQPLDLSVTDSDDTWRISGEVTLTQSDFGVKPYSLMMGTLKVVDDVRITIDVTHAKDA